MGDSNGLSPLIKDAAINGALHFLQKDKIRHSAAGVLCLALAAPVFLLALVFMAYAVYTGLLPIAGQPLSLLYTGLGLAVISGATAYTGARLIRKKSTRDNNVKTEEISKIINELLKELEDDITQSIIHNPKATLTTAAVAGFITGKNMQ